MPKHKYSRQRESIIENLRARTDHPTADMVYSDIRQVYPNISLGTVYRNLSLLAEEGTVHKLVTDDGVLRFDSIVRAHNHFICRSCGSVTDLNEPDVQTLSTSVEDLLGCSISHCDLLFYGLCKCCRTGQTEADSESV